MNIVTTSIIPTIPEQIVLGELTIQEFAPDSSPFIDKAFLEQVTNRQRRKEYITSRVLFSELTQKVFGEEKEVYLGKEPLGKPFFEVNGKRSYVSFTHSKSKVFCAISESLDIGVDCERSDRIVHNEVVKRILSTQEWKILGEEDPITLWTIKEAAVKSLGTGLRTNLKEIELSKENSGQYCIKINSERKMSGVCFKYQDHHVSLAW